jgi:hypothetical protein
MDHLPHPLSSQSQATHHQPSLHRCPRPTTLRSQGRLPRRVFRRCGPHRPASNLRGHLCPASRQRDFSPRGTSRASHVSPALPVFAAAGNSRLPRAAAPSHPQISSTLPRTPHPSPRPSLPLRMNDIGAGLPGPGHERLQRRGRRAGLRHGSPQHRGRAALQRRVSHPDLTRALAPVDARLWARVLTGHWPLTTGNCSFVNPP